ncbi:MAG: primosomal protein N' [Deltaproteobacteria bacterium]|nr:MAG: primosomal protein N' [Deltaproteobacteria bacterium]
MTHVEVAVAAPLNTPLTYALPQDEAGQEGQAADYVGRRVLVPLGGRQVTGYILGEAREQGGADGFVVKPLIRFLDDFPVFHPEMVAFFRWIADYYLYPIGLVIKTALPQGLAPRSVRRLVRTCSPEELEAFAETRSSLLSQLLAKEEVLLAANSSYLAKASDKRLLQKLLQKKLVRQELCLREDQVQAKREVCFRLVDSSLPRPPAELAVKDDFSLYRDLLSEHLGDRVKISEAKALYSLMTVQNRIGGSEVALREAKTIYPGAGRALGKMAARGVVEKIRRRVYRNPFGEQLCFYPRPEELTREQSAVLDQLLAAIEENVFAPFLLHGVTGCGKTEVYLRAAEKTIQEGRDVIILVPEIALASQLEAHLVSRFADLVVLLHSGLSSGEKYDQFFLALSGRARIVIGARSAVFAPLRDPGLIVVDEEHDSSYKQDDGLRYNARDLAVLRARQHGSVVLLGSATPSMTSFSHARSGKYRLLVMQSRVGGALLPKVEVVDLNSRSAAVQKKSGIIQQRLLEKLKNNLALGRQSLLLLNRRGFSTALLCRKCGTPVTCNHCNVSLTLHKGRGQLVCHYCGFTATVQNICLHCRSTELVPAGFGTERVEEELLGLLPEARIGRLDSDTAADRKKCMQVLSTMHQGLVDILIGTQMIAKGHHFPNVTLVGVVWADGGMNMPDYKAAERTFQLITQVTGRAGRGQLPGDVLIQTLRPDHYAIELARKHKYLEFFEHEMEIRAQPAFPPFVRLILLRVKGRVEQKVQESAANVARACRRYTDELPLKVGVLGPAPAPLERVRDLYRWQVLLKGTASEELHLLASKMRDDTQKNILNSCTMEIDVDPENMM